MAPRYQQPATATRVHFNADAAAILLAFALAALIRLNVLPHIGW